MGPGAVGRTASDQGPRQLPHRVDKIDPRRGGARTQPRINRSLAVDTDESRRDVGGGASSRFQSATVALRPGDHREQRGDLRHAGAKGSETLAHLPALFVDLQALFELGLAERIQDLAIASQLGADLGDVTVGQRSECAVSSRSRATSCSRRVNRDSRSSSGTGVILRVGGG